MAYCPEHGVYTEGTIPGCPQCDYTRMNAYPTKIIAKIPCPSCSFLRAEVERLRELLQSQDRKLHYYQSAVCLPGGKRWAIHSSEDSALAIEPELVTKILEDRDLLRARVKELEKVVEWAASDEVFWRLKGDGPSQPVIDFQEKLERGAGFPGKEE